MSQILNLPEKSQYILIADDDAEELMLLKDAREENRMAQPHYFVENGEELLDYLFNQGKFASWEKYPLPVLILMDLNMPRKDEALKELKEVLQLRRFPVVVIITSKAE